MQEIRTLRARRDPLRVLLRKVHHRIARGHHLPTHGCHDGTIGSRRELSVLCSFFNRISVAVHSDFHTSDGKCRQKPKCSHGRRKAHWFTWIPVPVTTTCLLQNTHQPVSRHAPPVGSLLTCVGCRTLGSLTLPILRLPSYTEEVQLQNFMAEQPKNNISELQFDKFSVCIPVLENELRNRRVCSSGPRGSSEAPGARFARPTRVSPFWSLRVRSVLSLGFVFLSYRALGSQVAPIAFQPVACLFAAHVASPFHTDLMPREGDDKSGSPNRILLEFWTSSRRSRGPCDPVGLRGLLSSQQLLANRGTR